MTRCICVCGGRALGFQGNTNSVKLQNKAIENGYHFKKLSEPGKNMRLANSTIKGHKLFRFPTNKKQRSICECSKSSIILSEIMERTTCMLNSYKYG